LFKGGAGGSTGAAVASPDTQQPCSDVGLMECTNPVAHPVTEAAGQQLQEQGWSLQFSSTSPTNLCAIKCATSGGGLDCSDDPSVPASCVDAGCIRCSPRELGCNDGDCIDANCDGFCG